MMPLVIEHIVAEKLAKGRIDLAGVTNLGPVSVSPISQNGAC